MTVPDSPQPPNTAGLVWRPLTPDDLPALVALIAAGLATDGGLPLATDINFLRPFYLPATGATIAAHDEAGQLVAAAAVRPAHTEAARRAGIVGMVHPQLRGRGIGTFLIDWGMAQGRALLAAQLDERPADLVIATESLNPAAERLYARHGFVQEFGELVMRRDLTMPLPEAPLPPGLTLATWGEVPPEAFFAAYDASFRDRPGFPGWSAAQWIAWIYEDDDTFCPDLTLLAQADGEPVGFIACSDAWVPQVGVRPEWRGRGLAAALLVTVMRGMRAAGGTETLLTVATNNPRATRVYERLGFEVIGRRARFSRMAA